MTPCASVKFAATMRSIRRESECLKRVVALLKRRNLRFYDSAIYKGLIDDIIFLLFLS